MVEKSKRDSFQVVLPIPKGPPRPTVPGTTLHGGTPSIMCGTVVEDLPLDTAAWCPSWHLCGSVSQGCCKVLLLVQFNFYNTRDCPWLELPKKQVLKVMDQTVHRQTVYPIYKSEIEIMLRFFLLCRLDWSSVHSNFFPLKLIYHIDPVARLESLGPWNSPDWRLFSS